LVALAHNEIKVKTMPVILEQKLDAVSIKN
jgi:hypothetical protein